ncbi:MAG: SAM-dependent chlorinase/fluorinase [Desulfobacterota bacterium]|nr:SAM-dependent chlorinase/fluorinase [Thermodesulfobacteriota bacterium]MDW8001615.1 SAM-dependent chlorinase/fluorinase [Deltaproteobacteria bacterium]
MKLITLLTDFGTKDPYVGIMKGVILNLASDLKVDVQTIDITHEIEPQDIREAAFVIKEYYTFFPSGTIHVTVVDPGVGTKRRPIIVSKDNHLFVGPDNGIYTLILDEEFEVYEISNRDFMLKKISNTFHGRDIFAPVAVYLAKGFHPSSFGEKVQNPVIDSSYFPDIINDVLYGEIVRFDRFGNAITNIHYELFFEFTGKQNFRIIIKDLVFTKLSRTYMDDELTCLVGSSGYLEFARFKGSIKDTFGITKGEKVKIEIV